jgi:hypothetical protein
MSRRAERHNLIDAIVKGVLVLAMGSIVASTFYLLSHTPPSTQAPPHTIRCHQAYFEGGIVCNNVVFHLGPGGRREYVGPLQDPKIRPPNGGQ